MAVQKVHSLSKIKCLLGSSLRGRLDKRNPVSPEVKQDQAARQGAARSGNAESTSVTLHAKVLGGHTRWPDTVHKAEGGTPGSTAQGVTYS